MTIKQHVRRQPPSCRRPRVSSEFSFRNISPWHFSGLTDERDDLALLVHALPDCRIGPPCAYGLAAVPIRIAQLIQAFIIIVYSVPADAAAVRAIASGSQQNTIIKISHQVRIEGWGSR